MGGATSLDAMRRLLAAFLAARRFSAASTSGLFGSGATARLLLGLATPGGQSARSTAHIDRQKKGRPYLAALFLLSVLRGNFDPANVRAA